METEGLLDYQGRAGDHFHGTVEPSPGHIRCRSMSRTDLLAVWVLAVGLPRVAIEVAIYRTLIRRCPSTDSCTKIARFSAVAAAIFTAPPQNRAIFKAPRCAISSAKKIASERRFSLRFKKGTNLIPTAEFPAIPESAAKIASERRCAILVHSAEHGFVYGSKR